MSVLQRAQRTSFQQHRRASGLPSVASDFWYSDTGFMLPGGGTANAQSTLTLSAFWQGMRLISEGIASMGCQLFRRDGEDGRLRVRGQGLPYLLRWQPNPAQTAFEYWQTVASARLLRGIFVAEKQVDPRTGATTGLNPIHPDLVTGSRLPSGRIAYTVRESAGKRTLTQDEVFVVRGFTEPDGVTPMSVIRYGARGIASSIAAQNLALTYFKNGASPSLAVISEDELGDEGIRNLHASVKAYVNDRSNAFGVLPLEGGVKLEKIGLTPADAQLVLLLNLGIEDIARWLNIPLHMLRYAASGTGSYASLEIFSAEFVTYTLRPYCIAMEQAIQRDLVSDAEKDELFAEFNMDALLRGDLKSRYEAYRIGIMSGFLRRNEARIKENLPPADGLDEFITPLNMTSVDNSVGGTGDPGARSAKVLAFDSAMRAGREGYRMVMLARELAGRLVRKELAVVERLGREQARDGETWKREVRAFYAKFADELAEQLTIPRDAAREYAAAHGLALERDGLPAAEHWDDDGVHELAMLALTGGQVAAA